MSTEAPPSLQGVDPRQVQRELGDMVVRLNPPITLSSSTLRLQWTVRMPTMCSRPQYPHCVF